MIEPRWDGDSRGVGVGDATDSAAAIEELRELAMLPGWISEDADVHLGTHLSAAAEEVGLTVHAHGVEASGNLWAVLTYDPATTPNRRALRRAAWHVIGAVAEASTHVLEREAPDGIRFQVVTGMPAASTTFAPHGHSLTLTLKPR